MRTAQEIFDTVVKHLRQQGKLALSLDGYTCAYRGADGTKCAVGVLIPDELYSSKMEGYNLNNLMARNVIPSPLKEEFEANLPLLVRLQNVHDVRDVAGFERGFQDVATAFNLQYTAP